MKQGFFITFEGPDGSGKSTQIAYLREYFEKIGLPCVFTREPGGTTIGEQLRSVILNKENGQMCPMTEALLYAASRAQHVRQLIKPALQSGKIVVCDRYVDSSIAYQGYGRMLGDQVKVINELAVDGCMPDLTFLMELSPEIGKSRIDVHSQDRLEQEKLEFHNRVYEGYRQIAARAPQRFVKIDASADAESIRENILFHIKKLLEE